MEGAKPNATCISDLSFIYSMLAILTGLKGGLFTGLWASFGALRVCFGASRQKDRMEATAFSSAGSFVGMVGEFFPAAPATASSLTALACSKTHTL